MLFWWNVRYTIIETEIISFFSDNLTIVVFFSATVLICHQYSYSYPNYFAGYSFFDYYRGLGLFDAPECDFSPSMMGIAGIYDLCILEHRFLSHCPLP